MASKYSPIFRYKVNGKSMEPHYKHGDQVLVSRVAYLLVDPEEGDVVVVKHPEDKKHLIKRIAKVESEKYFVEGDNPEHSTDSRHFGHLTKEHIVGRVV